MICLKCGHKMYLRFSSQGLTIGTFFWGCGNYPTCKNVVNYIPKHSDFLNQKGMGYIIHNKLKTLEGEAKNDLIVDIKGQIIKILEHYVRCRIGSCYSSIYRYILIDFLENEKALEYFLKSHSIKNGPEPVLRSDNGARIFYDLYYDFMLVKSINIKEYLKNSFPEYFQRFNNRELPNEQYSFIDYNKNEIMVDDN